MATDTRTWGCKHATRPRRRWLPWDQTGRARCGVRGDQVGHHVAAAQEDPGNPSQSPWFTAAGGEPGSRWGDGLPVEGTPRFIPRFPLVPICPVCPRPSHRPTAQQHLRRTSNLVLAKRPRRSQEDFKHGRHLPPFPTQVSGSRPVALAAALGPATFQSASAQNSGP